MDNAALVIDNLADDGTVTASSEEVTMTAANLLTPHVSERWRSLAGFASFVLDLGSLMPVDTVMVRGMTIGPSSTVRVKLSSSDATGAAGDVDDPGVFASGSTYFDTDYGAIVYLLDSPLSCQFIRVDITDPDADYVEAGALLVGVRETFENNFTPGGGITTIDRSRKAPTSGGQTLTWNDNQYRRIELSFDWISATQRFGMFERMLRVNGSHKNVLLIIDPASDNVARDSIFGLVTDQTPVTFGAAADIYGKQLTIDERL